MHHYHWIYYAYFGIYQRWKKGPGRPGQGHRTLFFCHLVYRIKPLAYSEYIFIKSIFFPILPTLQQDKIPLKDRNDHSDIDCTGCYDKIAPPPAQAKLLGADICMIYHWKAH